MSSSTSFFDQRTPYQSQQQVNQQTSKLPATTSNNNRNMLADLNSGSAAGFVDHPRYEYNYHNTSSIGSEADGQDLYMKSATGLNVNRNTRNQG